MSGKHVVFGEVLEGRDDASCGHGFDSLGHRASGFLGLKCRLKLADRRFGFVFRAYL